MKLDALFQGIDVLQWKDHKDVQVSAITVDSRNVSPGSLFVAIHGEKTDGHYFIEEAVQKGASGIVVEKEMKKKETGGFPFPGVNRIKVANSKRALAQLASSYYSHPSRQLRLIGITGTNGKTTTSFLIHSIAEAGGVPTGLIGGIFCRIGSSTFPMTYTTPEPLALHGLFSKMVQSKLKAVVMEVSSHALALDRVFGCDFEIAIFTNFTQDHLDFHGNLENYFQSKMRLFHDSSREGKSVKILLNGDDPWSQRIQEQSSGLVQTYALDHPSDIGVKQVQLAWKGISAMVQTPQGEFPISSSLVGRHNLYNVLAAIGTGLTMGCSIQAVQEGIQKVTHVPGRFEKIDAGQDFGVVVDYAHTEDALFRLLSTAASLKKGRLITVFGCGGDRDRFKRPKMGAVVARWSDLVFLTSDNPRSEDPGDILGDIEKGFFQDRKKDYRMERYWILPDRQEAIEKAIGTARSGDLVVVAGKGHEDYQILGDRKIHFDDREIAREAIRKR